MATSNQSPGKKKLSRLAIYPADVVAITGKHYQTARRMLIALRVSLNKQPWEIVTIKEFAEVFGMDEEQITEFLK